MRHIFSLTACLVICSTNVGFANSGGLVDRYLKALNMDVVFDILKKEGVAAGVEMANDGAIVSSPAWIARLERIYDADEMEQQFRLALERDTELAASEEALTFFESDLGQRIVQIEIDARKALGEDGVEDAARERADALRGDDPELFLMITKFIKVNDLIDSNVSGALNSNLAFYRGMASNPDYEGAMPESFMLSTVWEQEPEIRGEMEDWTLNFSTLAYSALSQDEFQRYIDVSETPAGQRLNTALFAGFDKVFESQSYELGRATAEFMQGEDT